MGARFNLFLLVSLIERRHYKLVTLIQINYQPKYVEFLIEAFMLRHVSVLQYQITFIIITARDIKFLRVTILRQHNKSQHFSRLLTKYLHSAKSYKVVDKECYR